MSYQLTKYPVLNQAEQRTQLPKTYLVLGGAVLVAFLHCFNVLAMPVSNLVGLLLPAYLSLKAVETPGHQDDIQYLTYWVVFGFLNFLESFALSIVLYYFPWYFAFKSAFVLWLQLPAFRVSLIPSVPGCMLILRSQGAQKLYEAALRPALSGVTHSQRGVAPISEPASSIPHME
jgi:receptor expression-enhancing protein 5/6